MPGKKLAASTDSNCYLIAISCHQLSFKLAWQLNAALNFELELSSEYDESLPFAHLLHGHECYVWHHESDRFSVHLISNKGTDGYVYPKMPQIDYILAVTGFYEEINLAEGLSQIKSIQSVLTAFELDQNIYKHAT
jgi:hypothetical protein